MSDETQAPGTEILVSGRPHKVEGPEVAYDQITELWNADHEKEGQKIIGTPAIDYVQPDDSDGFLTPGQKVKVSDGTRFSVDPGHVS